MRRAVIGSVTLFAQAFWGGVADDTLAAESIPLAVEVARTTDMPDCTSFVDAAATGNGAGTAEDPYRTIAAAVAAAQSGAVICVAEGTYAEALAPGEKSFTLAGGFKSGAGFEERDSAAYVSKAEGSGGSFIRIEDPGPKDDQLTAIDGFEISGYSQAILRDVWYSQRFDITNNFIHDNVCADESLAGAGFALNNVSGTIRGNVIASNSCGRGGAGFLNDTTNSNTVAIESNRIDGNAGTEAGSAHGGALYLFGNTLIITGNSFTNNSVTQWGAGLYVGAYTPGNQPTTATLSWNVYRGNKAGDSGGGFFCDDGATCEADHEVYEGNCGGNILVDGGSEGSAATIARFNHITNVGALTPGCDGPGAGVFVDTYDGLAADTYSVANAIFWGNAPDGDFVTGCGSGCDAITVGVTSSLVQTKYQDGSIAITFGEGIVAPTDPLFVDAEGGDFRLRPDSPLAGSELGAFGGVEGAAAPPASSAAAPAAADADADVALQPAAETSAPAPEPEASAVATPAEVPAQEAFALSKELGTVEAWNAFLATYPDGFYADLARAYIVKLGGTTAPAPTATQETAAVEPGEGAQAPGAGTPAVARGADYMGFSERFNRYYTDPAWEASSTVFVSPEGGGDGASRDTPMSVKDAIAAAGPGTRLNFVPGKYKACYELSKENSGSYDDPIVLFGERNEDQSIGVSIECCGSGRKTCFNLEQADYVALDGFELVGGNYGVRAVGADYAASQHSRGIAVLNSVGRDQERDPFFSGQSDWAVWERNVGSGAKEDDGHGIYLSNGSDWNIVRFNETYSGTSSDFQINADPTSTCADVGIAFDDPRCDAYAGEGEGGQGASDYFLVDSNYFHDSLGPGANFTSVRRSIIRNNIFGPSARHGVSFWQETDNPKLGSSDNTIVQNLFMTTGRAAVQFKTSSTRNRFASNILLGVSVEGDDAAANPSAILMEVDDTVGDNIYRSNLYVSGGMEGRDPTDEEAALDDFSPRWFTNFPTALSHDPNDFTPTAEAPFLGMGTPVDEAPFDRNGVARPGQADLGPIELP